MKTNKYVTLIILTLIGLGFGTADAQVDIAQQAYAIFQQSCLGCHGPHGTFTEQLIIESAPDLIATGVVMPGNPDGSEFYKRLLGPTVNGAQMPFNQPPLSQAAIATIRQWIQAGAPGWEIQRDVNFITTDAMLSVMQTHLSTLDTLARPSARYFTMTHLYNAGESPEALGAYRIALSKLVNSLSWGFEIINPVPIDAKGTIFHIDLRDYEWDIRGDAWTQIENVYPYAVEFNANSQAGLLERLTHLREEMDCEVPFVYVDWFLANASLPPLYHDILDLPETDRELERELGIDVARNIQSAPGRRVWRAGLNNSGVSNNNRVVERHTSRYGAYWKSYDFAGSVGTQNIFTHPLSFRHDGGEVVFNLPNGLQAYYISDASGNRIDAAPTTIVSNPAASDPAVRNGLSCIGCHTEGMKEFEDAVRTVVEQTINPTYDKAQALRLYVENGVMDSLREQDTQRYRTALEATGGVFGGIEPVHRFYELFHGPVDAPHAAAAVGLETRAFLQEIGENSRLQNLGLTGLLNGGGVQRDAWTDRFDEVIAALHPSGTPIVRTPIITTPITPTPTGAISIPDANLRAVIEERLGKAAGTPITSDEMIRLTSIEADERGIRNLRGLEHAIRLERIEFRHNAISDLSPLAGLVRMNNIKLRGNRITDVSPLADLINVDWLGLEENEITDLSPLRGLIKLNGIGISDNPVSDVSSLASLISLEGIAARGTPISDFSALARLPRLRWIELGNDRSISKLPTLKSLSSLRRLDIRHSGISDLSQLAGLTQLTSLDLRENNISDISPLAGLTALTRLDLGGNLISDVSSLSGLTGLRELYLYENLISDVSSLAGLSSLETLELHNNAISDFSPLEGLFENTSITLNHNPGFPVGGPKIAGPWLWVMVPPDGFFDNRDLLAQASRGTVTELDVATNGATIGSDVGENVWTPHKIDTGYGNNITKMLTAIGFESEGDWSNQVVYGLVTLDSPKEQKTTMFAGSDNNHKVWLNGELVNENERWHQNYQEFFPVTLKRGENVLLVAVHTWGGWWGGFFGFAPDAEYAVVPLGTKFSLSTAATQVAVGEIFTVYFKVEDVTDLAGWQADIAYDPAVIRARKVIEGNFLKRGDDKTFFQAGAIKNGLGKVIGTQAVRRSESGVSGQGTLLSVRFFAKAMGKTRVTLRNFQAGSNTGDPISGSLLDIIINVVGPAWDVNEDGVTDAKDVRLVRRALGQSPPVNPRTDVNRDGVVNAKDLAVVNAHLGEGEAPAAPMNAALPLGFTPKMVEQTLDILRAADDGSLIFRRGIANLERLLASFVPEETALRHNYPNPFNPETWIPYQLAEAADVTLHIYAPNGALVRTLDLGHQPAGIYQYRSRAAYWDGRNEVGESVASGIYFYTLTADDFTATRKMLIMK